MNTKIEIQNARMTLCNQFKFFFRIRANGFAFGNTETFQDIHSYDDLNFLDMQMATPTTNMSKINVW